MSPLIYVKFKFLIIQSAIVNYNRERNIFPKIQILYNILLEYLFIVFSLELVIN